MRMHAIKKGMNILDRIQVSHMAQMQNMFDFPPAPKLDGRRHAGPGEGHGGRNRGREIVLWKGAMLHLPSGAVYLDNQMHDLHVERFLKNEAGDRPLRRSRCGASKDSPPYFHDGRLLTLEDTVEFFNLVLELKLTPEEKHNLVEFMRQL